MKSEEVDKIYQELKKTYTDAEIAESFVFSIDQRAEENEAFSPFLKKHRKNITLKNKIRIKFLYFKYQLQEVCHKINTWWPS